ncbi:Uncharacterised protein [Mycobacteroides abscessus subsp. abscessus]|nr:Uncharacterised protein [Mycobacteroides abscessus subsp. abscessus]
MTPIMKIAPPRASIQRVRSLRTVRPETSFVSTPWKASLYSLSPMGSIVC